MHRHRAPFILAAALLAPPTAPGAVPRADGATQDTAAAARAALDRARSAQRSFERARRAAFPRGASGWGRCDEHVGRFCLTHDGDDEWTPTPEPAEIAERRLHLLATLDSAAALDPADGWIAGQRVAYRLEANDSEGAARAAAACAAEPWWCDALAGFVLHARGRTRAAETAFDRALARLPAAAACEWSDIAPLLEGDDRDRYRDLPCGTPARARFEDRFWLLSDPAWGRPGLERRAEHFARRVRVLLQTDAASGYGVPWGRDLEELTVRYGWPAGWDVDWRHDPGLRTERAIAAHRPPEAQRHAALELTARDGARWRLDDEEPRSAWAPPVGVVRELDDVQMAVFRRAGRRLVVAALEPAGDATGADPRGGCARAAGLYLADDRSVVARHEGRGRVLRLLEPGDGLARWVGIETRCEGRPGLARLRRPLVAGSLRMSDPLLFEPGQALPGTLDAALATVRGTQRVRAGEAIGVFWEWYGPPGPASVTVELTREDRSVLRKALEWTGLARRRLERAGVRWTDPGADEGPGRAIRLELPDLVPGQYRLTLQVQSARVGTVLATRDLVVVR